MLAQCAGAVRVLDDILDAYGPRAESPSATLTRSTGTPSSSAAICAIAVALPVPMSCIAVTTFARQLITLPETSRSPRDSAFRMR